MNPALATPLYVLAGVVGVFFVCRMGILIRHRRRLRGILRNEDQLKYTKISECHAKFKRHVLYAPLFSTRHNRELQLMGRLHMGTIPLRFEAGVLLGYIALNIVFFFCLIDWPADFQEKMFQFKYAAGHLAVMNSPALVLTAGRNNPLIPLLGISFDAFNLLHRWIGRIMAVEAVVHMACVVAGKARLMSMDEITHMMWNETFFIYGLVALIGFVLIFFQAMSALRHAWYETFLHLHILLAVMSFVALWYHLKNLVQQRVLLGTVILWGLERAARAACLLWRNCGKQFTTATVEVLPADVARVDVAMARTWKFKAGQYLYLYIPSLGLWTSHPFSVAWTSTDRADVNEKRSSGDSLNTLIGGPQRHKMSFLIKGRDGFTKKLLKKARKTTGGSLKVTALAEGPFGGLHSLSSYGTVLLIAGGIGITHPISYLHEFVNAFFTPKHSAVRQVSLIWVVRSIDHLTWIQSWMPTLMSHPSLQTSTIPLSIHIYITAPQSTTDEYVTSPNPWAHHAPPNVPVTINWGKPDFTYILENAKMCQVGAMAVSVCGPGAMGDDVRRAVRERQGGTVVDLYEESFSW